MWLAASHVHTLVSCTFSLGLPDFQRLPLKHITWVVDARGSRGYCLGLSIGKSVSSTLVSTTLLFKLHLSFQ